MKFNTLSRRTAAAGAASALVAGALVGATTTAAQAAPIQNTYSCEGTSGPFPVTLDSDIPTLAGFPTVPAGFDVPAQALEVLNTFTVPSAVITTMQGFGITRLESADFAGNFGNNEVGVNGVEAAVSSAVDNGDGTHSFDANGANDAFEVPAAGSYDVLGPTDFTIDAYNDTSADPVLSVPCTLASANGSYQSIEVTKNDSESVAKAVNSPVQKGDVAKVKVKVTAPNGPATGKVVLKKGTKSLDSANLNAKGVATLKFPAKTVGKNKLVAIYKGNGYFNGSRDNVVVKVTR